MKIGIIFLGFLLLHLLILLFSNSLPITKLDYPFSHLTNQYYPVFLTPLGAFDGAHYILIAQNGYGQFQQAFFPLFPILLSFVSKLTFSNYLIAGLSISWIALFLGIKYFSKLSKIMTHDKNNSLIFLLAFPSSFYFLTIYPESLFLFLSSSALFFLIKKKFLLAVLLATLASFTKIQGVFLLIPFVIIAFEINKFSLSYALKQIKQNIKRFPVAASPFYGLFAYSFYLFIEYGDPLYYYHAQDEFGAERTSDGIIFLPQVIFRYIKILFSSQLNFQYFIASVELLIFATVACVLIFDLYKTLKQKSLDTKYLSVNLYSLTVLILPTLTGTLSSIPRYALLSLGFFFALSKLNSNTLRYGILFISLFLHLILFIFYINGYFVS